MCSDNTHACLQSCCVPPSFFPLIPRDGSDDDSDGWFASLHYQGPPALSLMTRMDGSHLCTTRGRQRCLGPHPLKTLVCGHRPTRYRECPCFWRIDRLCQVSSLSGLFSIRSLLYQVSSLSGLFSIRSLLYQVSLVSIRSRSSLSGLARLYQVSGCVDQRSVLWACGSAPTLGWIMVSGCVPRRSAPEPD